MNISPSNDNNSDTNNYNNKMEQALDIYMKTFNKDYEYNKDELKSHIKKGKYRLFFYKYKDNVIAGAIIMKISNITYYLEYLFVCSSMRGYGVGSKFMNDIIKMCKHENINNLTLECNTKLVKWYKKFGGKILNIKMSQFNDNGEKYIFMTIPINNGKNKVIFKPMKILSLIRKLHGDKLDKILNNYMIWKPITCK